MWWTQFLNMMLDESMLFPKDVLHPMSVQFEDPVNILNLGTTKLLVMITPLQPAPIYVPVRLHPVTIVPGPHAFRVLYPHALHRDIIASGENSARVSVYLCSGSGNSVQLSIVRCVVCSRT